MIPAMRTERVTTASGRFRRSHRLWAAVLATALVVATAPAQAAMAPNEAEIERLYVEGQQQLEAQDYTGAADSWTRLLELLPESGDNQAVRESVIINILDAHLKAYNQLVDESGNKDAAHLRSGKQTLDRYYSDFKRIHGDRKGVSAAVQDKAEELERTLAKAEESAGTTGATEDDATEPTPVVSPAEDDQPKDREVIVLQAQNNGTGLIVGGAVAGALGLGALAMIPIGAIQGDQAEEDFNNATTDAEETRAEDDGRQANAVLIAGAVLTPLLLGAAAAMLVIGFKQRRKAQEEQSRVMRGASLTPTFQVPGHGRGAGFTGLTLRGRF